MPTYEFKCDECGYLTEVIGAFDDVSKLELKCPDCLLKGPNLVPLRRLITGGSGVIFKGGDWPSQDNKRGNEDKDIQRQRRKAAALKNTGIVPKEAVIGAKEADERYDASKLPDDKIDDFYMKRVKDE